MISRMMSTLSEAPISYSINHSISSVNEGSAVTFTVNTTGVPEGTVLDWNTIGNCGSSDFADGLMSGSVTILNGTGTIVRTTVPDLTDFGAESFAIQLSNGVTSATISVNSYDPYWANVQYHMTGEGDGYSVYGNTNPGVAVSGVSKFGAVSQYYNGQVTTYNAVTNGPLMNLSSGDFTVEGWFRLTALPTSVRLFTLCGSASNYGIAAAVSTAGQLIMQTTSTGSSWTITTNAVGVNLSAAGAIVLNTWYHIAMVRSGSVFTMYLDGVAVCTYSTASNLYAGTIHRFGAGSNTPATNPYSGYMDEVMITKGVARYTSNFQVPTEPFPTNRS